MSEPKNARHVGGKQESGNRHEANVEKERNMMREKYQERG